MRVITIGSYASGAAFTSWKAIVKSTHENPVADVSTIESHSLRRISGQSPLETVDRVADD
jgi:hypothetical protein